MNTSETQPAAGTTSAPAIRIEELRHTYGSREALAGVSLQVERGEMFGLLGPNGGGKTTLFHVIMGLIKPTSGRIEIYNRPARECFTTCL